MILINCAQTRYWKLALNYLSTNSAGIHYTCADKYTSITHSTTYYHFAITTYPISSLALAL